MGKNTTRRDFIKTASLGTGMLMGYCHVCLGQERERLQRVTLPISSNNPSIQSNLEACRNCGRCREHCKEVAVFDQFGPSVNRDYCVRCGQCTIYCPNVITEKFHYLDVLKAIADPDKIVVATTAPSIRVAFGEMYGLEPGTNVEREIVGALKQLGVDYVFDATFAADLTIMEEASELLHKLGKKKRKNMPMFTSCCPAWIQYVKLYYPKLASNVSTSKSPQQMQGAMIKTYFAQKMGINPEKIVHFSVMPCTAKKGEILRTGMNSAGVSIKRPAMRDVDYVLTNRELAYMLNNAKVDFSKVQGASYDSLMGLGSGGGIIFGNTGGVTEAALRTGYKVVNGVNPPADFFELAPLRGFDSVKQTTVELGNAKLNIAVVHGINNMKSFIDDGIMNQFDFVEVMACAGGCIGGGGQPLPPTMEEFPSVKQSRMSALYQHDARQNIRLSCDNPDIKAIYADFLGKPLGKKSEKLLHVKRL